MGRGLSKLQKSILAEAKTREVVLFQEILESLCPKPNLFEHVKGKDKGDTIVTFTNILAKRDTQPWLWNAAREEKDKCATLPCSNHRFHFGEPQGFDEGLFTPCRTFVKISDSICRG